ncbi:hypothetical protein ACFL6M_04600 [Candidatus Eisenbacteria bacterium]|uniref:Uncharacterized protein n=1 Tax=Eiseniibacteriota bacterium TaxID=2212470 RepID=A0ABV6YKJ9_UNCEI
MRVLLQAFVLLGLILASSHASAIAASSSADRDIVSRLLCLHSDVPDKFAPAPALEYLRADVSSHGSGIDAESAHKYLGYAAVVSGGVALFSGSSDDFHQAAGITASGLAVAALVSGFMAHSDYFDVDEGFSTYNMHILLGTLSCVGFGATAVLGSADEDHGGVASAAAISMAVSVALVSLFE